MRCSGRALVLRGFALSGAFWGAFAAWLPELQHSTGVSDGELGLALGGLAVAALPVMPTVGRLSDRRGAVETLQMTLIASALTLALPALAGGFPALVVTLLVLGLTTGALDVALNAAAAEEEAASREGRPLMSLAHAAFSFGVVGGSVAAGAVRELDLPASSLLLLIAGATAAVAGSVPVHRPPAPPSPAAPAGRRGRPCGVLLFGVLVAAGFVVEDGLQTWSPLYLEQAVDARPGVSALGVGLFAGAMGVGRLGAHVLGRRWSDSRLVVAGALVSSGGIALLVAAASLPLALAGLALAGAGTSVVAPVLLSAVGKRAAPGRQGEDVALVNGLGYLGFITGPPLVGVASAATSMPVAFGLLAVIALLMAGAGPLVLAERRRARRPQCPPTYTAAGTGNPLKAEA